MPRVVSLFLPNWPTDRLRRRLGDKAPPPDAPLVLIGREGGRQVVRAVDDAARAAGLQVGMPAAKARILVPGLLVQDHEPEADAEALERLALWALQRVAPIVAVDPPGGLAIDSTGTEHLHGGEPAMLEALLGRSWDAADEFEGAYHHDWQRDAFARGAYSYVAVGGGTARAELAAAVDNTLFFAGEATDDEGEAATVTGALQSGERAAREVLRSW